MLIEQAIEKEQEDLYKMKNSKKQLEKKKLKDMQDQIEEQMKNLDKIAENKKQWIEQYCNKIQLNEKES